MSVCEIVLLEHCRQAPSSVAAARAELSACRWARVCGDAAWAERRGVAEGPWIWHGAGVLGMVSFSL